MRTVNLFNTRAQNGRAALVLRTSILTMTVLSCLAACGPAKWQETKSTHTGDPVMEKQVAPPRNGSLEPGSTGYISSDRLRGLDTPDQSGEEAPVVLEKNDSVEIMDPTPQGDDEMVKVQPRHAQGPAVAHGPIFVPKKFIADKPVPLSTDDINADRYVVIENIATETLRVYEHCTETPDCANKLILETDMVVGQDTPNHELRTRTGTYRIESWKKFYEDNQREYPSWMAPGAPAMPGAGQSLAAWTNPNLIPRGYSNQGARGAFGWYTAKIGPNSGEQWIHGTWGMASDGDKFIQAVRALKNDERISSHGCTRVENQAISLMHEILPAGTKVIKVYAREGLANENYATLQFPRRTWDWVMTSDDAMKTGRKMSASVSRGGHIMDQGRYTPENHAHAISGNVYGIPESDMSGVFLVDEGRLENYRNPISIPNGGFGERKVLPSSVVARSRGAAEREVPLPVVIDRSQEQAEPERAVPLPPVRRPVQPPVVVIAPVHEAAPVRVAQPQQPVRVAPPIAAPAKPPVVQRADAPKIPSVPLAPTTAPAKQNQTAPKIPSVSLAPQAKPVNTPPKIPSVQLPPTKDTSTSSTMAPVPAKTTVTPDADPEADTGSATTTSIPVPHRPLKKKHAVQN